MALRKEVEKVRVDFADGDWVDIRKTLTYGIRKAASEAAAQGGYTIQTGGGGNRRERRQGGGNRAPTEARANFSGHLYNLVMVHAMIVAWSDPFPVTMENVEELPDAIVDRLMIEIDKNNPEFEDESDGGEGDRPLATASPTNSPTSSENSRADGKSTAETPVGLAS